MRKIISSAILAIFLVNLISFNSVSATPGRLNSSGCHNSKTEWYHCHNNSSSDSSSDYDYNYEDEKEEVQRELTDEEIKEKLQNWEKCYNLENSADKTACYSIESQGNVYNSVYILDSLKKSKSCYDFSKYKQNYNECKQVLKTKRIHTDKEIKSESRNYSKCSELKNFSKDYETCLELKKENTENVEKKEKEKSNIEKKAEQVNKKIVVLYKKNPRTIQKLEKQIIAYKKKISPGTDIYILLDLMEKQIQELNQKDQPSAEENISAEKNVFNDSFSSAKKYLERDVFNGSELSRNTFYTGCDYSEDKYVDYNSCGFVNNGKYETRSKKIEWEHVVPAHAFGQSFVEWREWNSQCVDSKGKSFSGRNCASKVNMEYRYMESDMYNLMPAIGSVNAQRSNYSMAEIPGEERNFGESDIEISEQKFEPREEVKWDVARIYMYMDSTYPGKWIISNKNEKLFETWEKNDPVSSEECDRYKLVKSIQGNENVILKDQCK